MSLEEGRHGGQEVFLRPPAHPVLSLQGPFEESMIESVNERADADIPTDPVTRRTMLLDSPFYQRIVAGRWKQKPGEKYHPLWKLVAQMSFGLHLLARNMAKSEEEVMKILQAHVDDIDGFLERTSEDFDLAQNDMHERLRCLKLPLQHAQVFDRMLEDPTFRGSILDGNEKIERIVHRTKRFLRDSLKDVQKGFDATNVLEKYLGTLTATWQRRTPEHEAVFVAMLGNVEGWRKAFMELHLQGNKLAGILKKLSDIVNEMARRANVVSQNLVARARLAAYPTAGSVSSRSQIGSRGDSQIHKPLPSAPGHYQVTRRSSRSTKHLDNVSQPTSASRSGEGRSSGSSARSGASQDRHHPRNTPTPLSMTLAGSETTSQGGTPLKAPAAVQNISEQTASEQGLAIELPADVPEDVMRNAPMSNRNRLSYTLGLKPKDDIDHRVSSIYYPKALGALLKVPQSPEESISPLTPASRAVTFHSATPHSESQGDYFATHEGSPSPVQIAAESMQSLTAPTASGQGKMRHLTIRSPVFVEDNAQRQSSVLSPGLTSHPSVMAMAAPPIELPAVNEPDIVEASVESHSRSRQHSGSSLGEPGPEITNADVESVGAQYEDTHGEAPSQILVQAPTIQLAQTTNEVVDTNSEAGKESSPRTSQKGAVHEVDPSQTAPAPEPSKQKQMAQTQEQESARNEKSTENPASSVSELSTKDEIMSADQMKRSTRDVAYQNDVVTKTIIAELEAIVPQHAGIKQTGDSPVELEAPAQHFRLPPRTTAKAKTFGKDYASATITHWEDFFKLPNNGQAAKPGLKPKDFNQASKRPEPIKPLKLKLTKLDGRMVPVQVHTPTSAAPDDPRASTLDADVIANMIEQITSTPLASPTHERLASGSSSNHAQTRSEQRTSRPLAVPGSAPAPPGPGGRSMVTPDYAAAGQFEGERKHPKRSSGGSISGIKTLLNGSPRRRESGEDPNKSQRNSLARQSPSVRGSGSDMLTSAGKDVLWFKGEEKTASAAKST